MEVKALVNGLEVVASGVVHVVGPKLTLLLDLMPVDVNFFVDGLGMRYATEAVGVGVNLNLYNFHTIGDGVLLPLAIANSNGRPVYITFWVSTVNSQHMAREFRYNILMGPSING
ncbi:hypothetical protein D3C80_1848920 [compost metagenome]